jgi:hypothetical protein
VIGTNHLQHIITQLRRENADLRIQLARENARAESVRNLLERTTDRLVEWQNRARVAEADLKLCEAQS